jgi:hypothetical protein
MSEELERFYEWFLELKGIDKDDVCPECNGFGTKTYPNTSTWRHGIGGQAITTGVCDRCWGSGSKSRPWRSWRTYDS